MESAKEFAEAAVGDDFEDLTKRTASRDAAIRADEAAKRDADYKLYKDGDKWCCVKRGFIDLQASDAWFGDTPEEALGLAITQGKTEKERV